MITCVPASRWQERWLLGATDGICDSYLAITLRWRESFDRQALERALVDLVARHESLRTTLRERSGAIDQCIHDGRSCPVREITLEAPPNDSQGSIDSVIARLIGRPTRIEGAALVDAALIAVGDGHILVLRVHHSIADAWTYALLKEELRILYAWHAGTGERPCWPPPAQVKDHATAERGLVTDSARAYWRARLRPRMARPLILGAEPGAECDRTIYHSDTRVSALDVNRLRDLARTTRAPLSAGLAAVATARCLHPAIQQVRIAYVYANRYTAASKTTAGLLADMLPIVIDVTGEPTLRDLIRRVRDAWTMAFAHRMSFWDILDVSAATEASPVCDFTFNYVPYPGGRPAAGIESEPLPMPQPTELQHERWAHDHRDGPVATVLWGQADGSIEVTTAAPRSPDTAAAVSEVGRHFSRLLTHATSRPDEPLQGLDGVSGHPLRVCETAAIAGRSAR